MSWTFDVAGTSTTSGSNMSTLQRNLIIGLAGFCLALIAGWGIHATFLSARVASLEGTVKSQKGTIDLLTTNLQIATDANTQLSNEVKVQNEAVQKYLDAAAQATANAKAAVAKAKADGEKWRKKYEAILSQPPANPEDECQSLGIRLNQYLDLRSSQ